MGMVARLVRPFHLLAPVLLIAFPLASHQSDDIVVVSVVGKWVQRSDDSKVSAPLVWGEKRPATGYACGTDGNSIVLAQKTSIDQPVPFPCNKEGRETRIAKCPPPSGYPDCSCAVCLDWKQWPATRSLKQAVKDVLAPLFAKEPDKYMVAVSRGVEEELVDSVAPIQGDVVDLSAAFHDMDSGQYWLSVTPIDRASSTRSAPIRLEYKHGLPATVTLASIQPGLYKILIVDQSGEPAGSDCWILATTAEAYPSISRQFDTAREQASKWPGGVDPSNARALLRAYLESLRPTDPKKT